MGKGISKPVGAHELEPVSLGELIHQHVRPAIETAVHEELQSDLVGWRTRSLAEIDALYLYLDAFALRVRSAGKVVSDPV